MGCGGPAPRSRPAGPPRPARSAGAARAPRRRSRACAAGIAEPRRADRGGGRDPGSSSRRPSWLSWRSCGAAAQQLVVAGQGRRGPGRSGPRTPSGPPAPPGRRRGGVHRGDQRCGGQRAVGQQHLDQRPGPRTVHRRPGGRRPNTHTYLELNPAAVQRKIQALTDQLLKITTSKAQPSQKPSLRVTRRCRGSLGRNEGP